MNVDMDDDNNDIVLKNPINIDPMDDMVGLIKVIPCNLQIKNPLYIAFSSQDILKHAPNGPLYIANRIYDKPTNGILIDPIDGENVITK